MLDLNFNWGADSGLWTEQMKKAIRPDLESGDSFFMSYEDFVVNFDLVHICMVDKFQEIQTKGVFKIFGMDHLFLTKNQSPKSSLTRATGDAQGALAVPLHDRHQRGQHRAHPGPSPGGRARLGRQVHAALFGHR